MKRFLRVVGVLILLVLLLCGGLTFSLRFPKVQNFVAHKAVDFLSYKLGTKVSIQYFDWGLFRNIDLKGFYLADKRGDTLIYAGNLNVNISYWSIINKQVKIKGITLDDAKVHLVSDTSGKLNIATLFENGTAAPSSKTSNPTDTTLKPMTGSIELKSLNLNNTDFSFTDLKNHLVVAVKAPMIEVLMNKLALQNHLVDIHSLRIDKVDVVVESHTTDEAPGPPPPAEAFHFLPKGWLIKWDEGSITNSHFALKDHTKAAASKGIDFAHLDLTDIHLQADRGAVATDSIVADIKQLATREKSGFELRTLRTEFKIAADGFHLDKLLLETPNSSINSYLGFKYSQFDDFSDFPNKVYISADLGKTYLSLKDLNYFLKNLDPLAHNTIHISGKIKGKFKSLQGKNIVLSTGTSTYLKLNFSTNGLPDIQNTSLNLRIDEFLTTTADIRRIYPTDLYPPSFNTLGAIRFNGDFDGFLTDFVTRGNLYTDNGSASSDLNFKYDKDKKTSAYSGNLALTEFNMGRWFGDTALLGKVSLKANVKGGGVKLQTLNAKIAGDVTSITLKGYDYKDLKVDGLVKGKYFSGTLLVNDKYLDADFKGTVDLNGKIPTYNFASNIRSAHLRELHLSKDTFDIRGSVTANFTGRKPDDMVGSVVVNNLYLQHNVDSTLIKNVTVTSMLLPDSRKQIKLESDNVEGNITGRFSFAGLPKAFKSYVNYTFTKNYEDTALIDPQQFTFDIKIYDSSALTRVINPKFKEIRNSVISGELNTVNHIFNFKGSIPEAAYDKYLIKRLDLNGNTRDGKVDILATVDKFYSGDSLALDTLVLHTSTEANDFRFDIISNDPKNFNRANITAYLTPLKASAELRFAPSEVYLGGNKWSFLPDNKIKIKGKQITSQGLVFASGVQSIKVDAYLKNDTSTSLNVTLTEASMVDFINIFSRKVKDIRATINGTIKVEDVFSKPALIANIEARDFYLGKILLGNMKVNSTLDDVLKRVNINATLSGEKNDLAIGGYFDINKNAVNLNADINSANLNFLNHPVFAKYVRNVTGTVSANLNFRGPLTAGVLTGKLKIKDANVNVSYLNTTYRLANEEIEVGDGYFDIGEITVIDRFNNTALGHGRIYHDHFKKITLDLHVKTDVAEFINTTAKDMPTFYGNGLGKGSIDFTGTIPFVNIRAYAQVKAGTHCYIPINNSYETNKYSFYRFINPQKDTIKVKRKEDIKLTGVNFILDLDVTPEGQLDILLDPAAGDILTSRGRGNIKIELLRSGEFNIYGLYEIASGSYLFTLQNIINKRFELDPGGTISFRGDINNAQLNANAVYQVRTSTYDLISDLLLQTVTTNASNGESERAKSRIRTDLLLKLKGVLQSPEVSFDIRPIDPDPLIRTYVDNKMQLVRSSETEMNKQVFGLLVMNRFLPTNTTGASAANDPTSGRAIGGSVANTVSEFLTSQLSMYVSNFFDNINVKDFDVNFNFRQYDQSSAVSSIPGITADNLNTRRELQLALTKRFFNNRLAINAGGNLDFGDRYTNDNGSVVNNKTTFVTGDFQIEYTLDKNGAWRAKAYNKGDYDNFNQRNINRTGIGITYRQDFDNLKELFRRRPRKPKPMNLPIPAKPEEEPKAIEKPSK